MLDRLPDDGGGDDEAHAILGESLEKRAIFDFRDDLGPDLVFFEPLVERSPDFYVRGRQEKRRIVERLRKIAPVVRRCRAVGGEDRDGRLADHVIVDARAVRRGGRRVRQHQIDAMQRQLRQQPVALVLVAVRPDRLAQTESGLQKLIDHELGQRVHDADVQTQAIGGLTTMERGGKLLAEAKNLVGVSEDLPSRLGQGQPAAVLVEELRADRLLERGKLAADRGLREAELLRGARDAALFGDDPKVMKMLIVQSAHTRSPTAFP
jgi:hypothetical protein